MPSWKEIRYRLGKRVTVVEQDHNCILLMTYPLKVLSLSQRLSPFFRKLETRGESTLQDLSRLAPEIGKQALVSFLYKLEKGGYVESSGMSLPSPLPKVSVIVPVRNRPHDIGTCLTSLLELNFPKEKLQIIVVDDASEDETATVAESFPVTLHRMRERQGASSCRNWGARHAEGDILCFVDSDCVADRDWLIELLAVFREPAVAAAGGLVSSYDDKTALDRYERVKSSLRMGTHCTDSAMGNDFFYLPSCNLAVRRDCFLELGGFDDRLEVGEDVDLCWRIVDKGHIIEYRPSARVLHRHRNSVGAFCRRRFEYGTSEPLLQALHPDRIKTFILWPRAFIFWILAVTTVCTGVWALGGLTVLCVVVDTIIRRQKVASLGVPLNPLLALAAVLRSNASFLFHCCSFVSRYYLIWATLLTPVLPLVGAVTWVVHLGVGAVELFVRKPKLSAFSFLVFFSLEQLSYQAGVWFGCLRSKFFSPLFPRISMGTRKTPG
jgi:mycofactocin system glycosyltransferase